MQPCRCVTCELQRLTEQVVEERKRMSKFSDLAKDIAGDMQNLNDQADEIRARRETLRRRGETVMARYRDGQADLSAGLDQMEKALNDMEGSNSKNSEGSGGSSETFRGGESSGS